MKRQSLADRTIKALKPASRGSRYDVADGVVPGLAVRVTDKGQRTFVLVARFPGSRNPTRRALGIYGAITLEQARQKARRWIEIIQRGADPRQVEEEARIEAAGKRANTFAAVAEDFIKREVSRRRRASELEREIRKELIVRWAERPVTEITSSDVIEMLDELVDRGSPYQAHSLFATTRRLFNWAIGRHKYGLEHSPCDRIRAKDAIGEKEPRTRVLSDDELRALWRAFDGLAYPFGPLFRLLLLTGQRKSEVGEASWSEIDGNLWTIPPERMKAGGAHVVPLSPDAVALLDDLPRFRRGDYIFSTTYGSKPVSGFSKAKTRLDKLMLAELRKLATARGADPAKVKLRPWRIHDLRRTVRTHLSALPEVPDLVRELVIAHSKPGLHKVYDQHAYIDEKRRALDLWAGRLRSIVEPPPPNVVSIEAGRG